MDQVVFERPNIKHLLDEGLIPVDMHYHTNCSDGSASASEVVKKAQKLGIGVSITDHNEVSASLKAYKLCKKSHCLAIPGIEVNFSNGRDVLFYFYNASDLVDFYEKHIKPFKSKLTLRAKLDISETLEKAHSYACISCAAHPFGYLQKNMFALKEADEIMRKMNCLEVMNAIISRKRNMKALNYAIESRKPFTGGSDGHELFALGRVVTCSNSKTVEGFLEDVLNRSILVVGEELNFVEKLHSVPKSLAKIIIKAGKTIFLEDGQ